MAKREIISKAESPFPNQVKKAKGSKTHRIADIYRNGGKPIDMTKIDRKDPNRRKNILSFITNTSVYHTDITKPIDEFTKIMDRLLFYNIIKKISFLKRRINC